MTLADIVRRRAGRLGAPRRGTVAEVQAGLPRVRSPADPGRRAHGRVESAVHVRDTLALAEHDSFGPLVRPVARFAATMTVYDALARMRRDSSHLVLVEDAGHVIGVVTITDLLRQLFPHVPAA